MYMYGFHHNQFELSTVIVILYKSSSLNQTIENRSNLTSWTLNHTKIHKNNTTGYQNMRINKTQINWKQKVTKFIQNKSYQTNKQS